MKRDKGLCAPVSRFFDSLSHGLAMQEETPIFFSAHEKKMGAQFYGGNPA
jgi:hypothetical protein